MLPCLQCIPSTKRQFKGLERVCDCISGAVAVLCGQWRDALETLKPHSGWNFPSMTKCCLPIGLNDRLAALASVSFHAGAQDDKVTLTRASGIGLGGSQVQIFSCMGCWKLLKHSTPLPGGPVETLTICGCDFRLTFLSFNRFLLYALSNQGFSATEKVQGKTYCEKI